MIVKSMNSREIMNEIAKDYPMVLKKAIYLTDSLRRAAVKSKNKHVYKTFDYKTKRQNTWLIIINYYVNNPVLDVVLHYLDDYGLNGILVGVNLKTLIHYTPHFLERYNERFLKQSNISKKELLKQYVSNNDVGHAKISTEISTMTDRIFVRTREGIGLGCMEKLNGIQNDYFHYKTFISNDMILRHQQETFDVTGHEYEKFWNETHPKIPRSAYDLAS